MSDKNTSKFISLILRHKPETIGITLDEHGWANVDELLAGKDNLLQSQQNQLQAKFLTLLNQQMLRFYGGSSNQ